MIVPCRNEAGKIEGVLDSILAQETGGIPFEILVADGASTDGTRATLERYAIAHPSVRIIHNPEGFVSHGLNRAITAAQGDIIIRMDAHTEYAPDYIRRCVDELESTGADNVGGPARTRPARTPMALAIAAAYHSPFSSGGARFHDPGYEGPVDTVTYGCWHRSLFDKIGMFDENLVRNQDDEFNLRTVRAGGKIWQSPRIVSWYHPRHRLGDLATQYYQYGFWKVAVIRKHKIPASIRHLLPAAFVGGILLLVSIVLLSAALGAQTILQPAAWLLALGGGAYVAATFLFALRLVPQVGVGIAALLPLVFAAYHFSYGSGFLLGLIHFGLSGSSETAASQSFTKGSR